jgi:hypothetical protein
MILKSNFQPQSAREPTTTMFLMRSGRRPRGWNNNKIASTKDVAVVPKDLSSSSKKHQKWLTVSSLSPSMKKLLASAISMSTESKSKSSDIENNGSFSSNGTSKTAEMGSSDNTGNFGDNNSCSTTSHDRDEYDDDQSDLYSYNEEYTCKLNDVNAYHCRGDRRDDNDDDDDAVTVASSIDGMTLYTTKTISRREFFLFDGSSFHLSTTATKSLSSCSSSDNEDRDEIDEIDNDDEIVSRFDSVYIEDDYDDLLSLYDEDDIEEGSPPPVEDVLLRCFTTDKAKRLLIVSLHDNQ